LLQYATNNFAIKVNSIWYENLGLWEEALKQYNYTIKKITSKLEKEKSLEEKNNLTKRLLKNKIGKLRCHHALN